MCYILTIFGMHHMVYDLLLYSTGLFVPIYDAVPLILRGNGPKPLIDAVATPIFVFPS